MYKYLKVIFLFWFIVSCGYNPDQPYNDTPTSGKVNISSDETLLPLARAQLDTFHGLYRYSSINMHYENESALFKSFINDSVKVIMSTRLLNNAEVSYFQSRNLIPVVTKVAIDAIAVILNKENKDSLLNVSQLKKILQGELASWKQINTKSELNDISFVFDNNGSSTFRYLKDSLMEGHAIPSNCFAVKSCSQVIDYVEKNKNAMGVIGVSWISDQDDEAVKGFMSRIKVAAIGSEQTILPEDYVKPYQAYISLKQYPLIREVYMISREGRAGLGTGFVSFVAGDQGQRIVRLMGLLPATMPVRIVKTH